MTEEEPMQVPLTRAELETMRVALRSAFHQAADEERALFELLGREDVDPEERPVLAHGRAQAAFRMQQYHLLAERVEHYQTVRPVQHTRHRDTPSDEGHA